MCDILGGKGANLAETTNIGMPVPQGLLFPNKPTPNNYSEGRKINDKILSDIYTYVISGI